MISIDRFDAIIKVGFEIDNWLKYNMNNLTKKKITSSLLKNKS